MENNLVDVTQWSVSKKSTFIKNSLIDGFKPYITVHEQSKIVSDTFSHALDICGGYIPSDDHELSEEQINKIDSLINRLVSVDTGSMASTVKRLYLDLNSINKKELIKRVSVIYLD